MDRPLQVRRNLAWVRFKRYVLTAVGLFALVFFIGSLPVAFVYFYGQEPEAANTNRAASSADKIGSGQRRNSVRASTNPLVAFVRVNVIPMDREQVLSDQTVLVKDGRIAEIGPSAEVKVPAAALRIDGSGKYLMPGLADTHVHLRGFDEDDNEALLRLFIANGVTTVLNLYGAPAHLELRGKIEQGELFGPTIYTSGPFISDAPTWTPTPEEAEAAVVEQKRAGYDLIKIHGDFSRAAYRRLFAAARREGIRIVGHAPRNLGVEVMLEEKQDAVAHAEEYLYAYFYFQRSKVFTGLDEAAKKRMMTEQEARIPHIAQATAKAGTWVIPNLTAYKTIGLQVADIRAVLGRPEVKYVPPGIAADWQPERNTYVRRFKGAEAIWYFRAQYGLLEKLVKGFRDAGVRMMAGTDTPIPSIVPGFSIHDELRDLVAVLRAS